MAKKPTIDGRKYVQLTDNILLEYIYVCDRYSMSDDETTTEDNGGIMNDLLGIDDNGEFVGTYAHTEHERRSTYGSCLAGSKHTGELYFCNTENIREWTNNVLKDMILPANSGQTKWVECKPLDGKYYTEYDGYWSWGTDGDTIPHRIINGEDDILLTEFDNDEYIVYDIVRVWFQSGYVSGYDGWVLNTFTKDSKNRYVNLACKVFMNTDTFKMASEPLWFNDRIYNNYVEWRQPSVAQMSMTGWSDSIVASKWAEKPSEHSTGRAYDRSNPPEHTLPWYLTRGDGFNNNPYIGFELFGIGGTYTTDTYGYPCRVASLLTSSMIPNRALNDNIIARVSEDTSNGDYIELYGYYIKDNVQKYDPYSLYEWLRDYGVGRFTFVHQVTVTENYVDTDTNEVVSYTHTPLSYIQTWDELTELDEINDPNPCIRFRPILEHTEGMLNGNCGATVRYVLRIMNDRDSTSIIKTASYSIINPKRYGKHLESIDMNGVNNLHIYNRIEIVGGVQVNGGVTNPIGNNESSKVKVNKFVTSSFIDRRNVKVSISPVNIADVKSDADKKKDLVSGLSVNDNGVDTRKPVNLRR